MLEVLGLLAAVAALVFLKIRFNQWKESNQFGLKIGPDNSEKSILSTARPKTLITGDTTQQGFHTRMEVLEVKGETILRITLDCPNRHGKKFSLWRQEGPLEEGQEAVELELGYPDFDRKFLIQAQDLAFMKSILTQGIQNKMLRIWQYKKLDSSLELEGEKLIFEEFEAEQNQKRLDLITGMMVDIGRRLAREEYSFLDEEDTSDTF